jgi:hypothetical protein
MAYGVDARAHPVQPTSFDAPLDRTPTDAEREQLPPAHHPMLPAG